MIRRAVLLALLAIGACGSQGMVARSNPILLSKGHSGHKRKRSAEPRRSDRGMNEGGDVEEIEALARLDKSVPYDKDAGCITVVAGGSLLKVLDDLGGDPAVEPIPLAEAFQSHGLAVALLELPGAVVASEINGAEAMNPHVLARLSEGTRVGSYTWGVNGDNRLTLAENGRVVISEEVWDDGVDGQHVDARLESVFAGLSFAWPSRLGAVVSVIERFTDVRLDGPPVAEGMEVDPLSPRPRPGTA